MGGKIRQPNVGPVETISMKKPKYWFKKGYTVFGKCSKCKKKINSNAYWQDEKWYHENCL